MGVVCGRGEVGLGACSGSSDCSGHYVGVRDHLGVRNSGHRPRCGEGDAPINFRLILGGTAVGFLNGRRVFARSWHEKTRGVLT